ACNFRISPPLTIVSLGFSALIQLEVEAKSPYSESSTVFVAKRPASVLPLCPLLQPCVPTVALAAV
ncbi:MAG: hypothetical protein ACO3NK_04515, partial [Prochlorotrichaceae cyanobacterium]